MFWKDIYLDQLVLPVHISVLTMIYESLGLLAVVLLSADRRRALVCAAFIFSLFYTIEFPFIFFIGAIVRPSLSIIQYFEETTRNQTFYLVYLFFINLAFFAYSFLAAHWIKKTEADSPRKITAFFSLIFVSIAVITFVWARDVMVIMSVSSWIAGFLSLLLSVFLLLIFYFYTRLIAAKEIILSNEKDVPYMRFIEQLSRRELDVIKAAQAGYVSQKDLASTLNISVNTVKTHLKNIYQITGVSSVDALLLLFHGYSQTHASLTNNHPKITPKSPKR